METIRWANVNTGHVLTFYAGVFDNIGRERLFTAHAKSLN